MWDYVYVLIFNTVLALLCKLILEKLGLWWQDRELEQVCTCTHSQAGSSAILARLKHSTQAHEFHTRMHTIFTQHAERAEAGAGAQEIQRTLQKTAEHPRGGEKRP